MRSVKDEMERYFDRLWPICRSLTGDGVRESLSILGELVDLKLYEVDSGTQVHDWEIPNEWNIRDAYIITPEGEKIADFKVNNLHLWSYSEPINGEFSYDELLPHLSSLPSQPSAIPYITTYYKRNWGFSLDHETFSRLSKKGTYKVYIDSDLEPGKLVYGEAILPGNTDREVLFSTYVCHPSMANNELSGPLVQAFLYREVAKIESRKYTYRFVFAPETIGIIAYLFRVGPHLKEKLDAGYVLTCCGDRGALTYKRSKRVNSLADRAAEHVLKHSGKAHKVIPFAVGGSDERQYCSPGYNLPVGSLMRTPYQQYKEYHTSLDNKSFISFDRLQDTVETYLEIVRLLEINDKYVCSVQHGEPQLGKRGLYPNSASPDINREQVHNLMHLLSYSDGEHDLIEVAELRNRSAFNFEDLIRQCQSKGIL